MNIVRKTCTVLCLILAFPFFLFSATLTYDTGSGSLAGLIIDDGIEYFAGDSALQTYNYSTSWGYLGRFLYEGGPTTLTVSTLHPSPSTVNNGRFYYFYIDNKSAIDYGRWKEAVLLFRLYGLDRNGDTIDIDGSNTVIAAPGDTVSITVGAGDAPVIVGEDGYDSSGNFGTYNGTNGFQYRYEYTTLWFDVTVVKTPYENSIKKGYYSSSIYLSGDGVSSDVYIEGQTYSTNPSSPSLGTGVYSFNFNIERMAPEFIPFTDLINKTTLSNSYLAGILTFNSSDVSGSVSFSSESSSINTAFKFVSTVAGTTVSIPYHVVFDPVISGNATAPTLVTDLLDTNTFMTDSTSEANILTGDVRIYLDSGLSSISFPAATYSSTIYAIFTSN